MALVVFTVNTLGVGGVQFLFMGMDRREHEHRDEY